MYIFLHVALCYFLVWEPRYEKFGPSADRRVIHVLFIRNHFISNLVLGSLIFKKLLDLQGNSQETLDKVLIEIVT